MRDTIISRTPLRMSFVGGGSDLPSFYRKHGGAVVSTAINKFVYITLNDKFDHRIRVSYSRTEEADTVAEVQHPLVREAMKMLDVKGGIEITSVADIPSKGSGLGLLSAFTVGLLHALACLLGPLCVGGAIGERSMHDRNRTLRRTNWEAGPICGRLRRLPFYRVQH